MKLKKLIISTFIMWLFLISTLEITIATKEIDYVGITEGNEYIWRYTIDEDGYDAFLDDLDLDLEDDDILKYQGRKIIIKEIQSYEKKYEHNYLSEDLSYDGVEVKIDSYYINNFDEGNWKSEKDNDTILFEFDDELYTLLILISGLSFMPPFIATNVDWEDVIDELKDFEYDYVDIDDMDVDIEGSVIKFSITWSKEYYDKDDEEEEIIFKYTKAGVLEYFKLSYDDEQIILIELQENIIKYYLYILICILVAVTLGLIYIYIRRKEVKSDEKKNKKIDKQKIEIRIKKNFILTSSLIFSIFFASLIVYFFPIREDIISEDDTRNNSTMPEGIRLIFINNPNDSIAIIWYTVGEADDPKVEYSTAPNLSNSKEIEPSDKCIVHGTELSPESIFILETYVYTAKLTSLEPNTTYYYRVSSDDDHKREIMNFSTLPNNISELKFIVISDVQTHYYDGNVEFLLNILAEKEFDFYIHLGDITNDGEFQYEWNEYFNYLEPLNAYKAGLYVEGNHDGKDSLLMYDNILMNSSYGFYFGNLLFFLGLNTQDERTSTEEFINDQLNKTNAKWKISIFHKHIYSSYIKREDLNVEWTDYFMKYNVDMVMYGHNHYYERQWVDNSYYILNPPFGEDKRDYKSFKPRKFTQVIESIYGFIMIKLNQTQLYLQAWGYEDHFDDYGLYDELTIIKF